MLNVKFANKPFIISGWTLTGQTMNFWFLHIINHDKPVSDVFNIKTISYKVGHKLLLESLPTPLGVYSFSCKLEPPDGVGTFFGYIRRSQAARFKLTIAQ